MKNGRLIATAAAALLVSVAPHTQAATIALPKVYQVTFTRAMDPCTGPGVTVVNPGNITACPETHVTTDAPNANWQKAKLKMSISSSKGTSLSLGGKGFITPAPTKIGLQLTLRVTNQVTGSPAPPSKTYEDETFICGNTAGTACGHYFATTTDGKIAKPTKILLTTCLSDNNLSPALATGNIEVVGAALINCDNGLVFGTPGVVQPATP